MIQRIRPLSWFLFLPLEDISGWAAEGNQAEYDILTITFGDSHRITSKVMRCARAECEAGEIDLARGLLEAFVKAVAGSLLDNHVFESLDSSG